MKYIIHKNFTFFNDTYSAKVLQMNTVQRRTYVTH